MSMKENPFYDKGTPTCPSPWPDEPIFIDAASPSFVLKHGGELSRKLVQECKDNGWLGADLDFEPQVCVRCTWGDAGTQQHIRTDWHYDNAKIGYVYIAGESPTEVMFDRELPDEIVTIEPELFICHATTWHRCPPQKNAGWRYFFRCNTVVSGMRNQRVKHRPGQ
jgi:hypothetical protein